jgi:hypothetical protein
MNRYLTDLWRYVVDTGAAITTVSGWFLGWMPTFGAMLAILWYSIQIWESQTVARIRIRVRSHPLLCPPDSHLDPFVINPVENEKDDDYA